MTATTPVHAIEFDTKSMAEMSGRLAVLVTPEGTLDPAARTANRLSKGAIARLVADDSFAKVKPGQVISLAWPAGLQAEALDVVVDPGAAQGLDRLRAGRDFCSDPDGWIHEQSGRAGCWFCPTRLCV